MCQFYSEIVNKAGHWVNKESRNFHSSLPRMIDDEKIVGVKIFFYNVRGKIIGNSRSPLPAKKIQKQY